MAAKGVRLGVVGLVLLLLAACSAALPPNSATQNTSGAAKPSPTPAPGIIQSTEIPTALPIDQAALVENRLIVLEWPAHIRESDSDVVLLSLIMDTEGHVTVTPQTSGNNTMGQRVQIPDVFDSYNVVAAARLDIAGLGARTDEDRQPLYPGKPVSFDWTLHADNSGMYRGVVWLYLDFVPKKGGDSQRITLLSRPIQIDATDIIGLPGWAARGLGGAGMLVSTFLGLPFAQKLVETMWARRPRRPGGRPGGTGRGSGGG